MADALSKPQHRAWALQAIDDLRADDDVVCVPVDAALFGRALELYRERTDEAWSLTDCISFVVMTDHGLSDALTPDVHFEQAGFRALLRASRRARVACRSGNPPPPLGSSDPTTTRRDVIKTVPPTDKGGTR